MTAPNKPFIDAETGAKSESERRWILENQGKHFCECGCGKAIKIIRNHRYKGIPRFIGKHHLRQEREKWIGDHQGKHFCQCGCGQTILIRKSMRAGRGIPRYIRSHASTARKCIDKWVEQNQGKHICSCGCGQTITITKYTKDNGIPATCHGHSKGMPLDLWVKRESGKHFCGCGCDKPIKILREHRRHYIPRFILGHNAIGSSNPAWRGGTSKTYATRRGRLQPKDWTQQIKDRDGHRCQWTGCGSTEKLHAHHLIPFSKDPSIIGKLWNGITLCETCHYKVKGHELHYAEFFLNLLRRGA